MISYPDDFLNLLDSPHKFAHLLTITLSDTTLNFTDAPHDVVHHAVKYLPGFWTSAPRIRLSSEPKIDEISIQLNAQSKDLNALFNNQKWLNQSVEIRRVYFHADHRVAGSISLFKGILTEKSGSESPKKATLDFKAASMWADYAASRGRKTNQDSQHAFYPNDNGFEFSGQVITDIPWGREGKTPARTGGGGGSSRRNLLSHH
jgi:hypothetical protein